MKTIYNTYVVMESQEQCDRMKQLCIDNDLPIFENVVAFKFGSNYNLFSYDFDFEEFFILPYLIGAENKIQVTEQEFINLLKKNNYENTLEKTK